jgi:hypothetical protein
MPEDGGAAVPPTRSETGPKLERTRGRAAVESIQSLVREGRGGSQAASFPTTHYGTIAGRCPRHSRRVARRIPLWTRLISLLPVRPEDLSEFNSVSDPRIAPDGRTVAVVAWRVDREANDNASAI